MDHIRTYRVRSLHEALRLIREDLGPDAAVLHTREVRGGLLGWRTELEVTASAEIDVPFRLVESRSHAAPVELAAAAETHRENDAPPRQAAALDYREMFRDNLSHDDAGLDLSADDSADADLADDRQTPESHLRDLNIQGEIAREILTEWNASRPAEHDHQAFRDYLIRAVERRLIVVGPTRAPRDRRTIAALVGPTGVGKTTSLAKMAAGFRLQQNRRVGLVTVDTYRVGAVDQLRTYAEIMDLPMEVASSPREMREALSRLNHCEVVLIDTAGRSPRDAHQMRELNALLAAACPDEVHLVAGAVAEIESLHDSLQRFTQAGAGRLILTKTDEAARPGRLLAFLQDCPLPISYVTTGQNVPDDIRPADAAKLAEWLVGERDSKAL